MLDRVLNGLLQFDPDTRVRLASLAGTVVAVELRDAGTTFYLLPDAGGIAISTVVERAPDVRIAGRPLDLIAHLRARGEPSAPGRVEIQGDLAVAQALQSIGRCIDIDWEELVSRYVGDVAAHQLGRLLRAAAAGSRHARRALADNLAEYAQYEARIVATRSDVDAFLDAVDDMREDVDRLEARIARLTARAPRDRAR
jgi:ubiquinone biosynthesis protein UbiJ